MTDQKLRFYAAVVLTFTHMLVPLVILFSDVLAEDFSLRVDIALTVGPVAVVYLMTVVIFATKNRYSIDIGKRVSKLFSFLVITVTLGYVAIIWMTLYNAHSFGDTTAEVLTAVKSVIGVVEFFYAGIFATLIDGLFEGKTEQRDT